LGTLEPTTLTTSAGEATATFTANSNQQTGTETVTASSEGLSSATASVEVAPLLKVTASASPSSGVAPLDVTFTASASGGTGSYTYSWSGAVSGSGSSVTKTFNDAGTYTATVTVTSGRQTESDSASVTVTVTPIVTLKVFPDSTWVYAGADKEFTVKGYDQQGNEGALDSSKVEWSTTAGSMNPSSGQTTSTLTAQEEPTEEGKDGTVTANYPGATDGVASVRVWPCFGVLETTGPASGVSGQPCTFTALVWDSYGRMWKGSNYPTLTYRWWHCGMSVPPNQGVPGEKTHSFTWEVPWWKIKAEYVVRFYAEYTGPNGEPRGETANWYEITIWRWGGQ